MYRIFLSVVGQVLLSLFHFGLSVVYIRYATKSEYGLFTLLLSAVYLIAGIHNALVCMPLTTLFQNAVSPTAREVIRRKSISIRNYLSAAVLTISALGAISTQVTEGHEPFVFIAVGLASIGIMLRDYRRCWSFLCGDANEALRGDLVYVGTGAVLVMVAANAGSLDAKLGLLLISVAAFLSSLMKKASVSEHQKRTLSGARVQHSFWSASSWSLAATLNTWMLTGAYLYVVQWAISLDAVAEISAAKLLFVPIGLIANGWSNIFRPKAGIYFRDRRIGELKLELSLVALAMILITAVYTIIVYFGISKAIGSGLLENYHGVSQLIVPWSFYFLFTSLRTIAVSVLLSDPKSYSLLFRCSSYALLAAAVGVFASTSTGSVKGVVWSIALAELILLVSCCRYSSRILRS